MSPYKIFARGRTFEVVRQDARSATFRQMHDAATLAVYPFRFELDVTFTLSGPVLEVEASVRNTGDGHMPASIGFHPAFRWPWPEGGERDAHYLEFDHEETAPIRRLDAAGLLTTQRHDTPVKGRRLMLHDSLFTADVLILEAPASRGLTYGGATGERLRVEFSAITHLGLWTKPGAGFLCIEPWRGVADPAGFSGGLDAKPGSFIVPPGGRETLSMRIGHGWKNPAAHPY